MGRLLSPVLSCPKRTLTMAIEHNATECALVAHRIACYACGYPACEARYNSVEEFEWVPDVYDEALGG